MAPFENWQGFKNIDPPPSTWEPSSDPASIEIPGLDTSAPMNEQIDQMDQLITIKLQNIERNFQIVHDTMANHILPAFQKYALSTEPIREAAQFWLSFYEASAQTSLPQNQETVMSQDETSQESMPISTYDTSDEMAGKSYVKTGDEKTNEISRRFNADETQTDEGFSHHGPVSSTPLNPPSYARSSRSSKHDETQEFESDDISSRLTASLETPVQRLGRQMQSLDLDITSGNISQALYNESTPTTIFHRGTIPASHLKNKEKWMAPAIRNDLLKKVATPKRKNPFIPPGSSNKQWDGIVDLAKSPGVPRFTPQRRQGGRGNSTTDTTDEIWPPGMSPLQFMKIDLPGVPNIQPSPRKPKDASRLIRDDVLASVAASRNATYLGGASFAGTTDTDLSVPALPSLSGVRWQADQQSTSSMSTPMFESVYQMKDKSTNSGIPISNEQDSFSDESEGGSGGNAFQILAQNAKETTGSSDSDSDSEGLDDGTLHPAFANVPQVDDGDDSFDDSFNDGAGTGTGTNLFAPRGSNLNDFALKGGQLLDDTLGIGDVLRQRAAGGHSIDSPTPFGTSKSPD